MEIFNDGANTIKVKGVWFDLHDVVAERDGTITRLAQPGSG